MGKDITFKGKTLNCAFYKGMKWNKPLTAEMKAFERKTGKNAVWRGEVTGTFEYYKYWKEYDESLKKPRGFQKGHGYSKGRKKAPAKKSNKLKQLTQKEVIELYKRKYKVKNVNPNTKKFAAFASKMLEKHTT